ncbi:MAG TPA: hypothetical protein EYN66_06230 [Myxococcales bacterium]|nr:hypothetical protein [Myxococcales bacterium]
MVQRSNSPTVMTRAPGLVNPGLVNPVTSMDFSDDEAENLWYTTWWAWTIIGTVVAGSVTAGILLAPAPVSGTSGWNAAVVSW